MTVIRKHKMYQLAILLWGVVVFGTIILTISGNARPYLSPGALPINGSLQFVGVGAVLVVLGVLVVLRLERNAWKTAGEQAGLRPRGASLRGKPDLVGTVNGRQVRAHTVKRDTGDGRESGSTETTFTLVETDIADPTTRGFIVSPANGANLGPESVPADLSGQVRSVGDVAVVGESDAFASEAITPRAETEIAKLNDDENVNAGEAADIFIDAIKQSESGLAGSMIGLMESKIKDQMPGGPETVGIERKGIILNGDDLEARAQAVVAVADGFENAIAGTDTEQ
jgi:hypothetical protein